MLRGLTAEIDLDAAAYNLNEIKGVVKGLPVIAVVKADAYGHGAGELSGVYERAGAYALATAFVPEARQLREAGIKLPILVLFDKTEIPDYFRLGLTPVLHDLKTAEEFSHEAERRGVTLDVHVKVETGMGRLGLDNPEDIHRIAELPNIGIAGLLSHFSEADLADADYTGHQLKRFGEIRDSLLKKGLRPICHMANSAAVLSRMDSHLDAVRPGLILYGCSPFDDNREGLPALRPLMRVTSKVLSLRRLGKGRPVSYARTFITSRDTLTAVIAAGYADGYRRAFSNNAEVLLNGRRSPVIGRVCMDLMVVDATEAGEMREQDDAVLMGTSGEESITPWELARNASTIPYEVMLWFGLNARRIYTSPQ